MHVPIFYTINPFTPACAGQPGFYRIFLGVWHVVAYGSGPPCLMFLFSALTLRNIKHRRIQPTTIGSNQDDRNSDKNKNLLRSHTTTTTTRIKKTNKTFKMLLFFHVFNS
jgi:hypothetical protein